jgi:hypothetical protein
MMGRGLGEKGLREVGQAGDIGPTEVKLFFSFLLFSIFHFLFQFQIQI